MFRHSIVDLVEYSIKQSKKKKFVGAKISRDLNRPQLKYVANMTVFTAGVVAN